MNRFEGKTVLITGDSRGIGAAIAKRFLAEGAKVIGLSNEKETENELNDKYIHSQLDLTDLGAIEKVLGGIKSKSKIDILINNAGIAKFAGFLEEKTEEFDLTFNINVKSHIFLSQLVARQMIKNRIKGKIVFTSSIKGLYGSENRLDYAASKAALISITQTMAVELGRFGINVNAVCPFSVETTFNPKLLTNEKFRQERVKSIPLGRLSKPEDVAGPVAFLASADADFITGTALVIDGGRTCAVE